MERGKPYWQSALKRVAARIESERGIFEPVSVTDESGLLWANYGSLRFQVGGSYPDLDSEADLWNQVDYWVAFERPDGSGVRMARDLDRAARWREKLDIDGPIWQEAARRLAADLSATSTVAWTGEVIEEDEEPILNSSDRRTGIWLHADGPPRRTRKLLLPRMNVRLGNWGTGLDFLQGGGLREAVQFLKNAVGDNLIEEFWSTEWPTCPRGDASGLVVSGEVDDPVWLCASHGVICAVGSLTGQSVEFPGSDPLVTDQQGGA